MAAAVPFTLCHAAEATDPAVPDILDLRAQATVRDAWLGQRLDTVIPMLMRREGIDMWLVINREYAEDPVYFTLVPQPSFAARRLLSRPWAAEDKRMTYL